MQLTAYPPAIASGGAVYLSKDVSELNETRIFSRPPAVGQVPTLSDGEPPDLDVQEQVVANQVKAATQWNDTAQDMVLSNIINEREADRETRWQIYAGIAVILLVFLIGLVWNYNNKQHDRLVAYEKAAAVQTPYTPETIR